MNGLPDCIIIVDCKKEHLAIKEAHRLEIPLVAVVDTNCDPDEIHHVIPGNDDAIRSVKLMASQMAEAINEGRGMAQSAIEQRAEAAMHGAAAGAVHIGEGGRIEYAGAPSVEMPPVDTGEGDSTADLDAIAGMMTEGSENYVPGGPGREEPSFTTEESDDTKSERSETAVTPAEGTLG